MNLKAALKLTGQQLACAEVLKKQNPSHSVFAAIGPDGCFQLLETANRDKAAIDLNRWAANGLTVYRIEL